MSEPNSFSNWFNDRLPIAPFWRKHMVGYLAPKNLNFWYFFGSLAMLVLVMQMVTGIWLAMFYTPSADKAFDSIEFIMRDVNFGWLFRYMHSTGASCFFIILYLHMFRSLLYGSHKKPRELLWVFGMFIFVLLLAEAFFGYLLPWGQMSYWAAQVITSLAGAVPFIGDGLALWLRGDYNVADATLHRFYALHIVAIPLLILGLVWLHLVSLHHVGSNNPDGIPTQKKIPFHPYYTVKDLVGVVVFFIIFFAIVFYAPEMGGYFLEKDNFRPADPLVTPDHIAPVWYMTPFYSILRAIPDKFFGVIAMAASIGFLFALPWLDRSPVRSIRYRGLCSRIALTLFVISFVGLGYLGLIAVTPMRQVFAQIFTALYFSFFILMPLYTRWEKTKPLPEEIT